ncbi:MAG: hypothetical protein SA339_13105 [Methanomassiliicoccus sp.]|nr:hypothetical protein [Methanomassiliicoccus sp.]
MPGQSIEINRRKYAKSRGESEVSNTDNPEKPGNQWYKGLFIHFNRVRRAGFIEILQTRITPFKSYLVAELNMLKKEETRNVKLEEAYDMLIGLLSQGESCLNDAEIHKAGAYFHYAKVQYQCMSMTACFRINREKETQESKKTENQTKQNPLARRKYRNQKPIADVSTDHPDSSDYSDVMDNMYSWADGILIDADASLCRSEIDKVKKWLLKNGNIRPDLKPEYLARAQKLIDYKIEDDRSTADYVQMQIIILAFVAFLLTALIVISLGVSTISTALFNLPTIFTVALFGALGGTLSGLYSFKEISFKEKYSESTQRMNGWLTLMKPVVGAGAAIAIVVFVMAGFFNSNNITIFELLTIAFASGFTERFINGAIDKVGN